MTAEAGETQSVAEAAPQFTPWRHLRGPRITSRVVRLIGILALMIPIVIGEIWPANLLWDESLGFATIVVDGTVPTLTGPTGAALALGLVAIALAPMIGSWNTRGLIAAITIRVVSSISLTLLVLTACSGWLGIWATDRTYLFIGEPSPGGCQVVGASGSSGFHRKSSDVGILQPGEDRVEWIVTNATTRSAPLYSATVTWDGAEGYLEITESDDTAALEDVVLACDSP